MKLVRYGRAGAERPGLVDAAGRLRDLSRVVPDVTPEVLSPAGLKRLRAVKVDRLPLVKGKPRLGCPLAGIGKIVCIGLNYTDHAAETNNPAPKQPPVFPKWANAIADPGEPVLRPRGEKTFDWEVELGVVIGRTARFVAKEQALDYVYGYTIVNDMSARDFQFHTTQWGAGKVGDTLAPVGPYIADRADIPDPHVLELKTWVNGTLMQNGNTKNFIFDIRYIIHYLTNIMTLSPGDLIATGTPAGVGFSRKPQITLQPGDRVKLEITGLGTLENPIKDA
jgi:2,4-diketo-3-deoxy-L-fuconate hydrolase